MNQSLFNYQFERLTGYPPFPWQAALYERFVTPGDDNIPKSCNLPTGLGKTSVIAVWLIALAHRAKVPRRLVYVVNRRTVVDQTTEEVEQYKRNKPEDFPDFAISTLRGQFADNRAWSADPSRPAVICGTVDMIGSRLLFQGYGVGKKSRPLHAGFLGQDALLVHDEAHLEPAFQHLIESIQAEQQREPEVPWPKFRVMELTATSRGEGKVFGLSDQDHLNPIVKQRIFAAKRLELHPLNDAKKPEKELSDKALSFQASGKAILIFANTVETVFEIQNALEKAKLPVRTLTGTMRGYERDRLIQDEVFRRFLPKAVASSQTVYLVCTSAGEVGVNISADHLICDLSTYESMAQRFGRVNRFGQFPECEVHVFYPNDWDEHHALTPARQKTLELLKSLAGKDVNPSALQALPAESRQAAFAPKPTILPVTDHLLDAWALTSITDKLPGRPKVEPYLHGLAEWEAPETSVAWREEVELLQPRYNSEQDRATSEASDRKALAKLAEKLLDDFPLKPHELLQDRMTRVREKLSQLAERHPASPAWVVDEDGSVFVTTLAELAQTGKKQSEYVIDTSYSTILLAPSVGGLNAQGMLDKEAPAPDTAEDSLDVSCKWYADKEQQQPRRARQWDDEEPPEGMRLIRSIVLTDDSEESEPRTWSWFTRTADGDDDASKVAREIVTWDDHTQGVVTAQTAIAQRLFPADSLWSKALILAAKWHDLGKKRVIWQRSIGNPDPHDWHAKSGYDPQRKRRWRPAELTDYRHEFGSLLDIENQGFLSQVPDEYQDLVLHLIAAHHGRARPHFSLDEVFDPNYPQDVADKMAATVPQRFARLQRQYGRWGLAYLESLLRAADWAASSYLAAFQEEQS